MLGVTKDKANCATKNDYELFLQAFQKPTQIYKLLGYRHCVNPVFLHRNTAYMKHRNERVKRQRSLEEVVRELGKKVDKEEQASSREGSLKINITGIDNKANSSKATEIYEIKLYLHKVSHKTKSAASATEVPVANLKFTTNDRKSVRSPSKMPSVTTIRGSTLNKHSSGKGCVLEFRVKLRSAKTLSKESPPSKKRRCVEEWFSAQVIVQNESKTTVLGDGSYTLFLRPLSTDQWKPTQISWETIASKAEENYLKSDLTEGDSTDQCSSISFEVKTDKLEVVTPSPKKVKKQSPAPGKAEENKGVLMYNFLYNGNTQQQTECRRNMVCPWCSLDCKIVYSLLEHVTRCHPRFKATFIPGLNGFDEIDVEVDELANFSHVSRPDEENRVPIFSGPNRRELYALEMRGSLTKVVRTEADFMTLDISPYNAPHNRLYFHSNSYEPILRTEVDYDSDNDADSMTWMSDKTKQLIQDFTDVNEGEKAIMIMWNCFILPVRPLADHMVPRLVLDFVREYGSEIVGRGLVNNLILHLTNLHSFGLLKAEVVEKTILFVYEMEKPKLLEKETILDVPAKLASEDIGQAEIRVPEAVV